MHDSAYSGPGVAECGSSEHAIQGSSAEQERRVVAEGSGGMPVLALEDDHGILWETDELPLRDGDLDGGRSQEVLLPHQPWDSGRDEEASPLRLARMFSDDTVAVGHTGAHRIEGDDPEHDGHICYVLHRPQLYLAFQRQPDIWGRTALHRYVEEDGRRISRRFWVASGDGGTGSTALGGQDELIDGPDSTGGTHLPRRQFSHWLPYTEVNFDSDAPTDSDRDEVHTELSSDDGWDDQFALDTDFYN